MEFTLLGPLEVRDGSAKPLELRGDKRRGLLALLLVHRGAPLALDRIVDALWDGTPSKGASGTVQTYVSQLRQLFAQEPTIELARRSGGYALDVAPELIDVARFEALIQEANTVDDEARVALLDEALALWRRTPLEEFEQQWATIERSRLQALRFDAQLRRIDANLDLGRARATTTELETLVAEHPLDESIWARLVLAYYRSGRQGDALRSCRDVRNLLVDQLGVEPNDELVDLERRILDHDETLMHAVAAPSVSPAPPVAPVPVPVTRALPTGVVTFLFTDIEGSTGLWDTQPAAMEDALAQQERIIGEIVAAHGGVLVKERGEGDSTFSVFSRASDAMTAAVEMQRALGAAQWPADLRLGTRIALHAGEAQLRDGDYFGPAPTRAARIRGLAFGGQVLCSQSVAQLVADSLPDGTELCELGPQQLRGLRRPEVVYELRPADADEKALLEFGDFYPTPVARLAPAADETPRAQTSFVGRAGELLLVRRRLQQALDGNISTLVLKGPPGIGKTRLLQEIDDIALAAGATVAWGRAYEHASLPYLPFRSSLLPMLTEGSDDLATGFAQSFEGRVDDDTADAESRGRLLLTFARAVIETARRQPLVVIVDDVHWADRATIDVLRHITWLAQRESAPLLVLAGCRMPVESEESAAGLRTLEREPLCAVITLNPLADHEIAGFVAQLGLEGVDRATIQRIRAATLGNPLLLEQLAAAARARGALSLDEFVDDYAPATAADALTPRLRSLTSETREVLTMAALLEPSAAYETLERAAPGLRVRAALDEGHRLSVIDVFQGRVRFAHPEYPRVLVSWLDPGERRRMHRRLGEALTAGTTGTASAMEIATHFIKAGDLASPQKVVRLAHSAADQAFGECAWREAAEFYEAAEAALARCGSDQPDVAGHLAFRAALCCLWNLDNDRAIRLFERAIASFEKAGNDRELVRVRLERLRADLDTVTPFAPIDPSALEAALARLDSDDQLRAQARADLGMVYVISGQLEEARESATAALALGDLAPARARSRAHVALSVVAWAELRLEDALANLDAAISEAGATGNVEGHLAAATRRPLTLLWLGRVAQADRDAEAAYAFGDRHNLISGLVYPLATRVGVACLAGRVDDAVVQAEELILRCRLGDWPWALAFSVPQVAAVRALTEGPAAGREMLEEWRRLRAEIGSYPYGDFTDIFDVAVQMLTDPDARRPDLELPKWLAESPLSGALGWSGISAAAAEIAWWTGNDELARKAARALRWCDAAGMRLADGWLTSIPRALGIALAGSGSLDAGLATVRKAREWAASEDATLEVALCGWWECEIAKAAGVDAGEEAQAAAANVPSPELRRQRGTKPWS